jgi:hypothetical protein
MVLELGQVRQSTSRERFQSPSSDHDIQTAVFYVTMCSLVDGTNVSAENIASIFRIEIYMDFISEDESNMFLPYISN